MFDTAMTGSAHQPASTPSELDEKCRRVIGRHNRLRRLSKMRSLEIIIRNQQRMLEAAVDELFDDAEVVVIVASIGGETFTDWFNHNERRY